MSYRRKFERNGITDDLGESRLCPKCGSEMIEDFVDDGETTCYGEPISTMKRICTNEDCSHEEKVGGEKP